VSRPRSRAKPKPGTRQKFTREYKLEAVRLSSEGTKSVATVAAELGIDPHQLYRWRRAFERDGTAAFSGNGKINSQDEELHRLRRDLKRVTEERDFLKKAATFFAKESR
jgi:transposase